ncbi:MAG: hypothetical protein HKN47_17110 [Pirellulaceae bacterium]|nr:hypothetical protein [Pirellulaceae bacterium]
MFQALRILSVVAVFSFLCVEAQAGDPFRTTSNGSAISTSSLNAMGLSGMQVMPHQQAVQVRGQGARVWGTSSVSVFAWPGSYASSTNNYNANFPNLAAGGSLSAGIANGAFSTNWAVAGGFAAAGGN